MDEDELPEEDGEYIDLPEEEDDDVIDTEDGGAIVRLDDEEEEDQRSEDFLKNLAEELPETALEELGRQYLEYISKDKEARRERDKQYDEGIRRTGLGDDAPGGAQFQGASRVVHPLLTEACVDFAARAMKELFPADGPVKDFIPGNPTEEKVAKAKRKKALMNWQLTTQSTEFRAELEQLLTQVPLAGCQYLKTTWNEARNRPEFLFVALDDMYLPFAATNFYSAQRKTHVQYLTEVDYRRRVKSGMYRDIDLVPATNEPDFSDPEKSNNKIEGREPTQFNEDGLRTVYEIYTIAEVEEGEEALPYIITIDKISGKVLAIYRNWDELDESREELQWFVEFPFVPWRGAYPIGLVHMIGGISAASTGALRALLDSAHINNSQTMLKLKGGSKGGQSLNVQPGEVKEIEGGLATDDIRKLIMPMPYNAPSPVLYELLGFLVDAGRGVVRTSMEDIADTNQNAPVGTTLAKIEQGMVVFSAIHSRLHDAMARMLRILHRLNAMYLDDEDIEAEVGEELATRKDFEGPLDVVPVSDPNIFSEAQRFAQVQAISQRSQLYPQIYNQRKIEERILETLKIPNWKDLLAPDLEPGDTTAVYENTAMSLGKGAQAFLHQDHIAHIQTHLAYATNPTFGMNPLIMPVYLPIVVEHLKQHIAMWYGATVRDICRQEFDIDIKEEREKIKNEADKRSFDRMLAQATMMVTEQAQQVFAPIMPIIQQMQQMAQQMAQQAQPQQQDPAIAVTMADIQRRTQADQAKLQLDGQKVQMDAQTAQQKLAIEQQKLQLRMQEIQAEMQREQMRQQAEDQRKAADLDARMAQNTQDNMTALQIAQMEAQSGERIAVSSGTGINP